MGKRYLWLIVVAFVVVTGGWAYSLYENNKNQATTNHKVIQNEKLGAVKEFSEIYDTIVVGGEPEGVAAAVSAARNGAKTLLIEKREALGGLFTYGMLNFLDIPQGEHGESVSKGIFKQWHQLVGGGNAFGIEEAIAAFVKLVEEEPNLTLSTETEVIESIVEDHVVTAVKLINKHGEHVVKGKTFIDATQDADFAVMSHVPYFIGGEDIGIEDKKMSVTLMIHLKNVDWEKVRETAKNGKFGAAVVTDTVAWGFSDLHHVYKPVEENTRLRGLNLAKINDEYFINALQIFGVDGLNEQSKQAAIEKGKRETDHILTYLKEEFPGFEKAEVLSYPPELYVRETRHIWAEYQLPMSDVWTNRGHWDAIAYGAYPVDIQAQTPQDFGYIVSVPKQYAIPFRSLIPLEIDGVLVVGRSAGYSSLAAGSARVVPTGMATGEAAGVAAALSVKYDVSFREMSKNKAQIETLRETLAQQGAFVEQMTTDYPYKDEWYDGAIQTLINYGLIFGRYDNDMKVEEPATSHSFMQIIKDGIHRSNPDKFKQIEHQLHEVDTEIFNAADIPISRDVVADILVKLLFEESHGPSWQTLINQGLIDEDLATKLVENRELKIKEMFAISAAVIDYMEKKQ